MENILTYVAEEMVKLQLNYAEIQPYDDYQTIRVTKDVVKYHNDKLIELANLIKECKDGTANLH